MKKKDLGIIGFDSRSRRMQEKYADEYLKANTLKKDYKVIVCNECKSISVPDRSKWFDEPDICDKCLEKGWSDITLKDMRDDPDLFGKVNIQTPYDL